MKDEFHIIIIWEKARVYEVELERKIAENLEIVLKFEYCWERELANKNFAAFYGEKLEDIQYKVEHCGSGSFIVYIVRDIQPIYDNRMTSSGYRNVNINLFDLKTILRGMSDGSHQVHASDNEVEANTNSLSLFGMDIEGITNRYSSMKVEALEAIKIERNISGVNGWKDWKEFFSVLGKGTEYVVLRNFETIFDSGNLEHGDTDLLVRDRDVAQTIIAGKKVYMGKERVLFTVVIAGSERLLDLRYVGDNYFDSQWQTSILDTRRMHDSGLFYVPDEDNAKYSLLYHALVHKPYISQDYNRKLESFFGEVSRKYLDNILKEYMSSINCVFVLPKDKSVYVHPDYFSFMTVPVMRRLVCLLKERKYRGRKNEEKIREQSKCYKKIYSMFSKGYYLVIQTLRQGKAFFRRIRNK